MDYMNYESLTIEIDDRVATVTLNRPDQLNAVDAQLHTELSRIFGDVNADDDVDIVILTGSGRAFSAGGDIEWMQEAIDEPESFETTMREAKDIIYSLLDCEKIVIARVNGHAVGLGATLALFSDMIVATENAKIGDPHVSVGLVAGDGGAVIWPQLIGYARAKEYLLTGDLIPAPQAVDMGLINRAVPSEELDRVVGELVSRLRHGATKSIRWSKMVTNIGLKQLAHSMMDASLAYESMSNISDDHAEAVAAFREKRKPSFTGR